MKSSAPEIVAALKRVAEIPLGPAALARRNRVPWLIASHDMEHGWCLTVNVIDDPTEFFGTPLNTAWSGRQQWWGAALKVESVEAIPGVVAKLYGEITAKLLESATLLPSKPHP
jgi:hypothetical protein